MEVIPIRKLLPMDNQTPKPLLNELLAQPTEIRSNTTGIHKSTALIVAVTFISLLGFLCSYFHCFNTSPPPTARRGHHFLCREVRSTLLRIQTSEALRRSSRGLDTAIIQSLPSFSYGEREIPGSGCAVCMTEFEETEIIKVVPGCGHAFHSDCIDMWFSEHDSCPLCRSTESLFVRPLPSPPHTAVNNDDKYRSMVEESETPREKYEARCSRARRTSSWCSDSNFGVGIRVAAGEKGLLKRSVSM